MHDEIINQAREILTQRLYRTDSLTSPRGTKAIWLSSLASGSRKCSALSSSTTKIT